MRQWNCNKHPNNDVNDNDDNDDNDDDDHGADVVWWYEVFMHQIH